MSSVEEAKHRILSRLPLIQLIGEQVQLKAMSGRHSGLCPFHNEKSPSFYVFDNHYFCFGCKASGDAISFVRETKGLGFMDALRFLSEKYGIDAPELYEKRQNVDQLGKQVQFHRIMTMAQEFFQAQLQKPHGKKAVEYLIGRGFTPEYIQKFGFGCTPEKPWDLVEFLRSKAVQERDAIALSLIAISQKSGKPYDFFRERIMIPICDVHGRVIAFGGRTLVDDPAKYKNSAGTPLFDKGAVLFGMHLARETIRKKKRAIIVEGYMDALQLQRHGFTETVACMGTALSERHLHSLENLTSEVYIVFDGDSAGVRATLETIHIALQVPKLQIFATKVTKDKDPDELVNEMGADRFEEEILGNSEELIDYAMKERLASISGTAVPATLQQEFLPWINKLSDPIQKSFLMTKLNQWTGIPVADLQKFGAAIGAATENPAPKPAAVAAGHTKLRPLNRLEQDFLGLLFYWDHSQVNWDHIAEFVKRDTDLDLEWLLFAEELIALCRSGRSPSELSTNIFQWSSHPDIAAWIEGIHRQKEAFKGVKFNESFQRLEAEVKRLRILATVQNLKVEAKKLSRLPSGPNQENNLLIMELLRQINQLTAIGVGNSHSKAVPNSPTKSN